MSNKVLVHCKNTDQILEINEGDSLLQIYGQSGVELPYQVLCARVNNKTEDLDYRVFRPKDIEFIDASHPSGMRTYVRSLCFVFYKALYIERLFLRDQQPARNFSRDHRSHKSPNAKNHSR